MLIVLRMAPVLMTRGSINKINQQGTKTIVAFFPEMNVSRLQLGIRFRENCGWECQFPAQTEIPFGLSA
jgi:hypothetical protein